MEHSNKALQETYNKIAATVASNEQLQQQKEKLNKDTQILEQQKQELQREWMMNMNIERDVRRMHQQIEAFREEVSVQEDREAILQSKLNSLQEECDELRRSLK